MTLVVARLQSVNDQARQQLFRPYQPSSGHKYKNAEGLSANYFKVDPVVYIGQVKVKIEHKNRLFRNNTCEV
jgi:hypothetical protein